MIRLSEQQPADTVHPPLFDNYHYTQLGIKDNGNLEF